MRIGLFGGSFDPPHSGHVTVSEMALRRIGLHQLWWMVTPGNPLKDHSSLPSLQERMDNCRAITKDPRIIITAFEKSFRVRYTADTLQILATRHPDVNFVWIMGADNLANFHKWEKWERIAATFPIAVYDRPGSTLSLHSSKAAHRFAHERMDETEIQLLPTAKAPAWSFIHGPRTSISSTQLRDRVS